MTKARFLAALCLSLCATQAAAHSFESGADLYAQFVEGIWVITGYPQTLLPLLALGVLLGLWHSDGMVRAWPVFLAGQIVGLGLGALYGEWNGVPILTAGIITATLAALVNAQPKAIALGCAGLLGALAIAESLAGHGFFELPFFIYAGLLFATNLVVACTAALPSAALEKVEAMWMRIAWRAAASWLAAIMVLLIAFSFAAQ